MKRTTSAFILATAVMLFATGHWSPACALLYGTVVSGSSDSVLVTINPANGAATSVGTVTGFPRIDGLAARSDNTLFGGQALANFTGPMLTIDRTTAAGTSLGASGMYGIYALTFSSGGTLYASCSHYSTGSPDTLCTVSQSSGAATAVGAYDSTDYGIWVDGLAFNGSTLYGSTRSTSVVGAALYTVNTSTGAATLVAQICTPTACGSGGTQIAAGVVGLALVDSTLYGSTADGKIITIDPATGVYSQVGSIGMTGAVQDLTVVTLPATATPTLVPTITFTPTPFATAVELPTATPTPIPPCTLPSPGNACVPGKGPASTDCNMEWLFTAVPLLNPITGEPRPNTNKAGIPNNQLICYEGDPRCDFNSNPVPHTGCTLQTTICINNNDPRLSCVPSGINTAQVKSPNPLRLSSDGSDQTNLNTLEGQFDNASGGGFGVTVLESIPGGIKVKYPGVTNSTPNLCSAPLSIVVPEVLTGTGHVVKGRKTLKTVVTAISGKKDTDTLRLQCRPSTCGDGIIQKDHETCDDHNRVNGDGCNQACQIEPGFTCPVPGEPCISFTPTSTPTSGLPTSTPTSAVPTDTPTPTPTATCAPTGTPYYAPECTPCPTIRPGCYANACGLCIAFTPTAIPTETPSPPPAETPTFTATPTITLTPTITPTSPSAVCGNGVVEPPEDCDEGGTCTGGDNAGTPCTSDSQCVGQGICIAGANGFQACDTDDDCPWSQCVRCKVFGGATVPGSGGKTCAANCTFESTVTANLVTGIVYGAPGDYSVEPGTSISYVHASNWMAGGLAPLALAGEQVYAVGKLRNGQIPLRQAQGEGVVKGPTPGVNAIAVGGLACACVRSVEDMTCGGVLTEKDGTVAGDCTPGWIQGTCSGDPSIVCFENDPGGINGNDCFEPITPLPTLPPSPTVGSKTKTPPPTWTPRPTNTPGSAGTCVVPSPCAGKKPCAYVHGAGNTATGIAGCNGLDAANQYYSQDEGNVSYPAPGTPPVGSGPAVVKMRNACECTTDSDCSPGQTCDSAGRCTCTTVGSPLTINFDSTVLTFGACTKAAGVSAGKSLSSAVSATADRVSLVLAGDLVPLPDGDIIDCTFTISADASPGRLTTVSFFMADLIDDQSHDFFATGTDGTIGVLGAAATPTITPGANTPTPTNTPAGPRIAIGNASGDPGAQVSVAISLAKHGANIVAVTGDSDCKTGETCVCPTGNLYEPTPPMGPPLPCTTPSTGECIYYTGCVESSDCPGTLVCRPGPAGSIVVVNSTAIGLTPSGLSGCTMPTKTPLTGNRTQYGTDRRWCTDDDPQVGRGTVQTLPILSGFSAGIVTNMYNNENPPLTLGPYTQIGGTVDCNALLAPTPSVSGMALGGAFTALNQANLENTVTTNVQWAQ